MVISELFQIFKGESCVILGNGSSATEYISNEYVKSIGVNDIGRIINPDFLLLADDKDKFLRDSNQERVDMIENTGADYYICRDTSWNFPVEDYYTFRLGEMVPKIFNLVNNDKLDFGYDSPYMAILFAVKLGFKNIGILGVDYTPNHFYEKDGNHSLVKLNLFPKIDAAYNNLNKLHLNIVNLSEQSKITAFPKMKINDFYNELTRHNAIY